MLVIIIILLLVFGIGGGYYGHRRWGPAELRAQDWELSCSFSSSPTYWDCSAETVTTLLILFAVRAPVHCDPSSAA